MQIDVGVNGVLGSAVVAILAALGIWKRGSGTRLDVKRDQIQGQVLDSVFKERDGALQAQKDLQAAATANRDLYFAEQRRADLAEHEVTYYRKEVDRLTRHVDGLERELAALKRWLHENSGYVPLDETPQPPHRRKL